MCKATLPGVTVKGRISSTLSHSIRRANGRLSFRPACYLAARSHVPAVSTAAGSPTWFAVVLPASSNELSSIEASPAPSCSTIARRPIANVLIQG